MLTKSLTISTGRTLLFLTEEHQDSSLAASPIWFALRVCSKQWNSSYDALLNALTVPTLSSRRKTQKLVHCSVFSLVSSLLPHCPTPRNAPYSRRYLNSVQLTIPHCRTNFYKPSFFVYVPKLWNDLPFDVAAINSVTVLKHKLINAQL